MHDSARSVPRFPHRPLVPLALATAGGIWIADTCGLTPGSAWTGAVLLFLPVLAAGRLRPAYRSLWCLPWLLIGAEVLARAHHVDPRIDVGRLATGTGRLISLRGRIVRTPLGGGRGTYVLDSSAAGLPWRPIAGGVSFFRTGAGRIACRHGDRVEIVGRLLPWPRAGNPGERDRGRAARRRAVRARLATGGGEGLVLLAAGRRWLPLRRLEALRNWLAGWAGRHLDPEPAGLFRALVLGDRATLSERLAERFRRGGILHYLAISGLHVALAAGGLRRMLRGLGLTRGWTAMVLILVLLLQAGLAGFRTPVVRAAVLAGGAFVAPVLMRSADPWNLMGGAALGTLLLRPADLFSAGFGLSYAAVAGILLLANRLDPSSRILDLPGEGWLARGLKRLLRAGLSGIAVSIGAWLGSGPLIWHQFGVIHPWVPVVNGFVLPVFTATLAAALAAAVAAPLGPVAWLPATGFELAASALDAVGGLAAGLPGACIRVPAISGAVVLAGQVLLLATARRPALLVLVPALLAAAALVRARPAGRPEVTVLDVGQGLSVFLSSGRGEAFLYDAGSTDRSDVTGQVIVPFLRERALARTAALFLSHGERDHASGLPSLVRQGWVDRVVAAAPRGVPPGVRLVRAVDGQRGGGEFRARWQVLHPPAGGQGLLSSNDGSLVVLLEIAGLRLLLPGDVEEAGLARIIRRLDRPVDLLVMPHHGGHAWNLPGLLARARPRLAVVSARRGFADPRTLRALDERGIPVFFTWRDGALTLRWDSRRLTVLGHRGMRLTISRRPARNRARRVW